MSISISLSNKNNIIPYKNSTNNGDNNRDSGRDSGGDSNGVNKGYGAKMTNTQDELGKLVNYRSKFIPTSLYVKILTPGLRSRAAICFEFT